MAIAYDNYSNSSVGTPVTTQTFSHTCAGNNRLLIVGVTFGTGKDIVGVPTYGGANMTLIGSYSLGGAVFDKTYLYYLVNPATGANNVVITASASTYIYAVSLSYTGVNQTTPIDVHGSATTTETSITKSVTTTVDNDWLVGFAVAGSSDKISGVGANTALRINYYNWVAGVDSNAAKTPPGSYSLAINASASTLLGLYVVAIAPVGLPTVTVQAVDQIEQTQARGNGNITDTGGGTCDKRGFVYGTTSKADPGDVAPGASGYDQYVEDNEGGYGIGAFTKILTNLIAKTKYYVRAYASHYGTYTKIDYITASGNWTAPVGVTSINVECWGGGGGGGFLANSGGGGGGGGAYAKKSGIVVTPESSYAITVGVGGGGKTAGGDSYFNDGALVKAKGGSGGTASETGAAGGSAVNSIGDTKYAGGNGGNGHTTGDVGGGGGGGAGDANVGGNGANAAENVAGTGGPGGIADGGTGGNGGVNAGAGLPGFVPGGGGGGGETGGGTGANGMVKISYLLPYEDYDYSNDEVDFTTEAAGIDVTLYPSVLGLTIAPQVPTQNYDYQISVSTQALALSQQDPTIKIKIDINVEVSALELETGLLSPTLNFDYELEILAQALNLTQLSPTQNYDYQLEVSALGLEIGQQEPIVSIKIDISIELSALGLELSTQNPTVNYDYSLELNALGLELSPQNPVLNYDYQIDLSAIALALAQGIPIISLSPFIELSTLEMSLDLFDLNIEANLNYYPWKPTARTTNFKPLVRTQNIKPTARTTNFKPLIS